MNGCPFVSWFYSSRTAEPKPWCLWSLHEIGPAVPELCLFEGIPQCLYAKCEHKQQIHTAYDMWVSFKNICRGTVALKNSKLLFFIWINVAVEGILSNSISSHPIFEDVENMFEYQVPSRTTLVWWCQIKGGETLQISRRSMGKGAVIFSYRRTAYKIFTMRCNHIRTYDNVSIL